MSFKFNPNAVKSPLDAFTANNVPVCVTEAVWYAAQDNPGVVSSALVKFKVTEGEFAGSLLQNYFSILPDFQWVLRDFMLAAGFDGNQSFEWEPVVGQSINEFIGAELKVNVKAEQQKDKRTGQLKTDKDGNVYPAKSVIKSYIIPGAAEAASTEGLI